MMALMFMYVIQTSDDEEEIPLCIVAHSNRCTIYRILLPAELVQRSARDDS